MKARTKRTLKRISAFLSLVLIVSALFGAMQRFPTFFEGLVSVTVAAANPKSCYKVLKAEISPQKITVAQKEETESKEETEKEVSSESIDSSSSETEEAVPTISTVKPQDRGKISEYPFKIPINSSKIIWENSAAFSNTSKASNAVISKILKQNPKIPLTLGKPQVLIYHTHTTESYEMQDLGYYKKGSSARTTDRRYSVVRVGDAIENELKKAGIGVIHDKNYYDYPSYSGAYFRSADSVRRYLKKYPSISVTLDIHRDAIEYKNGTRVKPTAVINGKKAAQVMIIAGVDDGTMDYPKWRENMKFASNLQQKLSKDYKGLARAAMVCHRRYNMYLTTNSLLIEVGGHANTLGEAVYSGEMIGKSLVKVLKENSVS